MTILKSTPANLKKAAKLIKSGGVIVYPTDTAYAIGGRFDDPAVIRRILRIKGRSDRKFTVVASGFRQAVKFFPQLQTTHYSLLTSYWPGPLSIVVTPRFAVRVPASAVTRRLCALSGVPLIASSANLSGQPTSYSVGSFLKQMNPTLGHEPRVSGRVRYARSRLRRRIFPLAAFIPATRAQGIRPTVFKKSRELPDLILVAGRLPRRAVSTVVRVRRGKVEVVRRGAVRVKSEK